MADRLARLVSRRRMWAARVERGEVGRAGPCGRKGKGETAWAGLGSWAGLVGLMGLDFLFFFSFLILDPNQTQPKLVEFKHGFEFHSNTQTSKTML